MKYHMDLAREVQLMIVNPTSVVTAGQSSARIARLGLCIAQMSSSEGVGEDYILQIALNTWERLESYFDSAEHLNGTIAVVESGGCP